MDSRTGGYILQLRANNIGTSADLSDPSLTPLQRSVAVDINGVPCDNAVRTQVSSAFTPTYTVITCELQNRPVGYQNVTISAAGQTGKTTPADAAFNTLQVCVSRRM
jgi:hypothetical protein